MLARQIDHGCQTYAPAVFASSTAATLTPGARSANACGAPVWLMTIATIDPSGLANATSVTHNAQHVAGVIDHPIEVVVEDPRARGEPGGGEFRLDRGDQPRLLRAGDEAGRHRAGFGARLVLQRDRRDRDPAVAVRLDELAEVAR